MVIYIDLGCSTGKTLCDFLDGKSFLPELSSMCDKVYAFDPIRDIAWADIRTTWRDSMIEFYECAVGIKQGMAYLAMHNNPEASTLVQTTQTYKESPDRRRVKVINFLEWLEEHVRFEDTVILKMNIEGAEYSIMEALIAKPKLMNRINHLFVKFHSDLFDDDNKEIYADRERQIRETCPIPIN